MLKIVMVDTKNDQWSSAREYLASTLVSILESYLDD